MEISVFWPKNLQGLTDLEDFWRHHRGSRAHPLDLFWRAKIRVTWEIDDIRQNFGIFLRGNGPRYSCQNFSTYAPSGSPYKAIEILTLTPKNFGKLGETFLVVGGPGAPGGRRVGVCPKLKASSSRGPPPVQNKTVTGPLAQHTSAQWSPEEVKFLKIPQEKPIFGPPVPPTLTDGGKLFTVLTSTTGRLTNLKESPF